MIFTTDQQIFDHITAHLLKQGRRATSPAAGYYCRYRTEDGLKCAVGALIPDDRYDPGMEGHLVSELVPNFLLDIIQTPQLGTTIDLLRQLQQIHDRAINPQQEWPGALRRVAREFYLDAAQTYA